MGSWAFLACALAVVLCAAVTTASLVRARRATRRREEVESHYSALLSLAADAVVAYRYEPPGFGPIVEVNEGACRMLGRSRDELLGATPAKLLPPGGERLHRRTQRLVPVDRPAVGRVDVVAADGAIVHLEATVRRFTWSGHEYIIVNGRDVGERLEQQRRLRQALSSRETLLREIHHRVKNNLQTISSLMNIRMLSSSDPQLREALGEMADRVHAMGLLHRMLYETDDFEAVDLGAYTRMLSRQVWSSHSSSAARVAIDVESDPLMVNLDTALPLGLVLNEAITNALKHGFPDGRSGRIAISVTAADDHVRLTVADDGVGMDVSGGSQSGMGTRMIRVLADQLDGDASFVNGCGTTVNVSFPRARAGSRP